jgi:hypothetical protein
MNGECGKSLSCSCCGVFRPEPRVLHVQQSYLEVGDTVQVSVPAYTGYLGIVSVFVLPVVLFVAGLIVGSLLEDGSGAHSTPTLAGGFLGFMLAVAIAAGANKWLGSAGRFEVRRLKGNGPIVAACHSSVTADLR